MHHRRDHEHDQELDDSRDEDADDHAERAAVLAAATEVVVAEPGTAGHEGQVDRCELLVRADVPEDLVVGREAVGGVLQVVQQVERRDVRRGAQLTQGVEQHVAGDDHEDREYQLRVLLVERHRVGLLLRPPAGHRVGEALARTARVNLAEVEQDQLLDVVRGELLAVEPVDVGGPEGLDVDLSADGEVLGRVDDTNVELRLLDGQDLTLVFGANEQLVQLAGLDLDVVHQDDGVRRKRTQVNRRRVGLQVVPEVHQVVPEGARLEALRADVHLAADGQLAEEDGASTGQVGLVDVHERFVVRRRDDQVLVLLIGHQVEDLLGVEAQAVDDDDRVVREARQIDDLRGLDGLLPGLVDDGSGVDREAGSRNVEVGAAVLARVHGVAPFSAISRVG